MSRADFPESSPRQQQLEEEFERFIEFANLLDRQTRRYFVASLQHKLGLAAAPKSELRSEYLHYFEEALGDLFDDENLRQVVRGNRALGSQIVADTLNWFRKAYREVSQRHPYEDEQRELESWGVRHMRQFSRSWNFLIQKISSFYSREEINPDFHAERFGSILTDKNYESLTGEDIATVERVLRDLLAQWDARLQVKILNFQMRKLKERKEDFRQKLEAKVEEYQKLSSLLKPFTEYLGRYWDMSRALWQDSTFDIIRRYDELLQDEEELARLAETLGRLREAELETEEETYEKTVVRKEWVKDPNQRSEITGVRSGNDLGNILPSELALFGDSTEWSFLKRFADEELQVNRYEDRKLIKSNKVLRESYQRVKKKQKGPFIICVDTSGSMEGEPERIAKVLCFAILKMAAADERRAFLINFSSGIHTIDLYNLVDSIDEVAAFLQKSFHGGTDISLALTEALQQLENHRYQDADVLVISDFIMYRISDELSSRMEKQQHNHGTQFHSLIITDQANEEVIGQFDNVWSYDPDQRGVMREIYREMAGMAHRRA